MKFVFKAESSYEQYRGISNQKLDEVVEDRQAAIDKKMESKKSVLVLNYF